MIGKRFILFVCAVLGLVGCSSHTPEVELEVRSCASMPGGGRASAAYFVFNHQAYVFAGRDKDGVLQNDLWRYTPSTDSWEHLGATPLSARVNPTACVHGDVVYLGLGFNGTYNNKKSYQRDWWEYTPATNQWKRLADYPNGNTDCATAFTGNGELYVGYGFSDRYARDFFRYSIAEDRWDSIDVGVSSFGYPSRSFGGTGCTCNGRHFMGTGYYKHSLDWWAELLPEGKWIARAAVPGQARTIAASAASEQYVYLCGGMHMGGVNTTGAVLQDLLRYDPEANQWHYIAVMPEGLINHVCFVIDGKVYWGLGENDNWKVRDKLYCVEE